jgi:hypothetical protein
MQASGKRVSDSALFAWLASQRARPDAEYNSAARVNITNETTPKRKIDRIIGNSPIIFRKKIQYPESISGRFFTL